MSCWRHLKESSPFWPEGGGRRTSKQDKDKKTVGWQLWVKNDGGGGRWRKMDVTLAQWPRGNTFRFKPEQTTQDRTEYYNHLPLLLNTLRTMRDAFHFGHTEQCGRRGSASWAMLSPVWVSIKLMVQIMAWAYFVLCFPHGIQVSLFSVTVNHLIDTLCLPHLFTPSLSVE